MGNRRGTEREGAGERAIMIIEFDFNYPLPLRRLSLFQRDG